MVCHPYPGFSGIIYPESSRGPRKHWAKNISGQARNRSRLSVQAVRAFGRNTKTDDAGAASQPKRRGRGAVRRANGLSTVETVDFHCRFARHRASPASFRPSGTPSSDPFGRLRRGICPRVVGHEMLRVTNAHENAIPPIANHIKRYSCGVFVSVRDAEGLSCSASRRGPGRVKWRGGSPRRSRR